MNHKSGRVEEILLLIYTMPTLTKTIKNKILVILRLDVALRLVWQCSPGLTTTNFIILLVQGTLPLLSLYLMKLIIDSVTAGFSSPDTAKAMEQVIIHVAMLGGVALLDAAVQSLGRFVNESQSLVVTDKMHEIIHAKSVAVDLEYYENPKYYDTLHSAQREAAFRPTKIVNSLAALLKNSFSLIAVALLLFSFHWGITLLLLMAGLPALFVKIYFADSLYKLQQQQTQTERRAWYYNWLVTNEAHAKEIRIFNLGKLFIEQYKILRAKLRGEKLSITARKAYGDFFAQIFSILSVFSAYIFIAFNSVQGAITIGDLVMFFQAFQRGQIFLKELLNSIAGLYEDNLFLTYLSDFLSLEQKVIEPAEPISLPDTQPATVSLEHVFFRYPTSNRSALKNISMTIQPGEHVALVGENGSGKTTLVKLLCKLYTPDSGNISMNGIDYQKLSTSELRKNISVLFQDYAKYNVSARQNIWFGNTELNEQDNTIITAAQQSGADAVISELSNGYNTILGKMFEKGEELSIGEWQKVALARAFLRQSKMLILDEPTSSLDAKMEHEIFQQFHELTQGKTALLISHRLSTVKMADRILVMHDGQIIEQGTHNELMNKHGLYADLFTRQARNYYFE